MNTIIPSEGFTDQPVPLIPWLRGLGVSIKNLTEEDCRKAATPPDPAGCDTLLQVSALVVHHSATESGGAGAFRVLHRLARGWRDVGYHFVIGNGTHSSDGLLERGRPECCRGAHAKGANEFSLGICLVGDFMTGRPTPAQMHTLGGVLRELMASYGLNKSSVLLHRQVKGSSTECPGKNLTLAMVHEAIDKQTDSP
ncbi:MAG: peptidoglycan recognition family protein [Candidatus Fermentibacteraceae bacterium]